MKAHELEFQSRRRAKRAGRGISAGRGKTAGRGTKGQNARSGGRVRPGFEGGQNPLMQRLPKLAGFHSARPKTQTVTLDDVARVKGKNVDAQSLSAAGRVGSAYLPIKLVASGKLSVAKTVKLPAASQAARAAVAKAGGKFIDSPVLYKQVAKAQEEVKDKPKRG